MQRAMLNSAMECVDIVHFYSNCFTVKMRFKVHKTEQYITETVNAAIKTNCPKRCQTGRIRPILSFFRELDIKYNKNVNKTFLNA